MKTSSFSEQDRKFYTGGDCSKVRLGEIGINDSFDWKTMSKKTFERVFRTIHSFDRNMNSIRCRNFARVLTRWVLLHEAVIRIRTGMRFFLTHVVHTMTWRIDSLDSLYDHIQGVICLPRGHQFVSVAFGVIYVFLISLIDRYFKVQYYYDYYY